jgi:pimeloyl-ACP methyl ester carboxylesterase
MRIFSFFLLLISVSAYSQDELIELPAGPYTVGFDHYVTEDSTRLYRKLYDWSKEQSYRKLPVSIWYPAEQSPSGTQVSVLGYLEILKEEEEWEHLPNEYILDWFAYENTVANRAKLPLLSQAFHRLKPTEESFPLVIYTPGYENSSVENFRLCEYLASHGYVVIACPSRGTETRFLDNGSFRDIETQARDIEFLIKEAARKQRRKVDQVYSIGFSFGGLASAYAQVRNQNIRGLVSLDGAMKYQYAKILESPYFDAARVDVPFLHFSQKDIPAEVLQAEGLESNINTDFIFFDQLQNSDAWQIRCKHLTHSYFTTLGVLFQTRDPRQDFSDDKILTSYQTVCKYTKEFLHRIENDGENFTAFLASDLVHTDRSAPLTVLATKTSSTSVTYHFEDFHDTVAGHRYQSIDSIYQNLQTTDPNFTIDEWKLNNLGLQLTFAPARYPDGIAIFRFAVRLFPKSANLYDSLAEAYLFGNEIELAREAFQASLLLNPENKNALLRLEEMK